MPVPQPDFLPGTLELMILTALRRGPMHGYAINEWIETRSAGAIAVDEAALYPALHRLQLKGLLDGEWGTSELNRRAKFYKLTKEGRGRLERESKRWGRIV